MLRISILLPALLAIFAANLPAQEISVHPGTQIPVELRTKLKTESARVGAKGEGEKKWTLQSGACSSPPVQEMACSHFFRHVAGNPHEPCSSLAPENHHR